MYRILYVNQLQQAHMFEEYFETRESLTNLLLFEHTGMGNHDLRMETWTSSEGNHNRKWYFNGRAILGASTGVKGTIFYTNDKENQCDIHEHA